MITIQKLSSLQKKTALRKAASLLQGFEADLAAGRSIDTPYLKELIVRIILPAAREFELPVETALGTLTREGKSGAGGSRPLLRVCNDLRHLLYAFLGNSPADWDLLPPGADPAAAVAAAAVKRTVVPLVVFLEDLRSPFNVGSVFRSAESFCVQRIILTPSCPKPDAPRASRSAMGCDQVVPWSTGELDTLDEETVFALETGGTPLDGFEFPERGAVILGNEELGISPEARKRAEEDAGIVSIPLYGKKASLNVTAAFAILMYHWSRQVLGRTEGRL